MVAVTRIEFNELDEKRVATNILPERYYKKWKDKSKDELDQEFEDLADKIENIPNQKVYDTLLEVMQLLDEYRKRRPEK